MLLADLIENVTELNANVVGVDYFLNRPTPDETPLLSETIQQAVVQQQTWFVFATVWDRGDWLTVSSEIANLNWSLEGDVWVPFWHVPPRSRLSNHPAPFSYQLALAQRLRQERFQDSNLPGINLNSQRSLQGSAEEYLRQNPEIDFSSRVYLQSITRISSRFSQRWLKPLVDFSIPPEDVYQTIPAWKILESPESAIQELELENFEQAIIIIAPGGYREAGLDDGGDNFPIPPAIKYWDNPLTFTGGESHAYLTHHILTNRLVVAIPGFGIVLIAALVGKSIALKISTKPSQKPVGYLAILTAATVGLVILSLQAYITAAIAVPWLLPTAALWIYIVPAIFGKYHE